MITVAFELHATDLTFWSSPEGINKTASESSIEIWSLIDGLDASLTVSEMSVSISVGEISSSLISTSC